MKSHKYIILLIIILAQLQPSHAHGKVSLEKSATNSEIFHLKDLEDAVIDQSLELKSKKYEVDAAMERRSALPSNYLPKLTLDGSYKYISEVPEISMAPGQIVKFGDNKNYSIGPTLSMTVFDFKSRSKMQIALDRGLSAKENERRDLQASYLFKTRFHYLNLVFLLERTVVISESLKVAKKQLSDILEKNRLGASSKLDLLTARKEVHELESQLKELQFNLSSEQSDIFKISRLEKIKAANFGLVSPNYEINNSLKLENLADLKNRFFKYQNGVIDISLNSKVKSLEDQAESLESHAQSINGQRFPKINVFARTSYDYPNGPTLEQFNQNTVGITLSMPLFDGGEISHSAKEKSLQAEALRHLALNEQRNVAESSELMTRRIVNLNEQKEIIENKIAETNEIADLIYKSYQDGRSTFLEVERANVKKREAKLSLSSNQYQIILSLIQLAAIAGE